MGFSRDEEVKLPSLNSCDLILFPNKFKHLNQGGSMEKGNTKLIKKIKNLKRLTRDRNIRIKLELFILALQLSNISEACARRGFGRSFYYKWWGRLEKSNFKLKALKEKSKRPKKSPLKIKRREEIEILELHAKGMGCRMIKGILDRRNKGHSTSTINHIINKRKRPQKNKDRKLNPHRRRYEMPIPGQRIQMDVKYFPGKIKGEKAYVYVAIDECTRWRFTKAYETITGGVTVDFMIEVTENAPFPINCIQTDNGQEFTYRFLSETKVHPLDDWCDENGIKHRCIPPGVKELNGKVERSHRIDEQYFYWRANCESLEGLNKSMKLWIDYYNNERPHGGLGYMTPKEKIIERMDGLKKEDIEDKLIFMRNRYLMEAQEMFLKVYKPHSFQRFKLAA
jgi:transposase InsO family protein